MNFKSIEFDLKLKIAQATRAIVTPLSIYLYISIERDLKIIRIEMNGLILPRTYIYFAYIHNHPLFPFTRAPSLFNSTIIDHSLLIANCSTINAISNKHSRKYKKTLKPVLYIRDSWIAFFFSYTKTMRWRSYLERWSAWTVVTQSANPTKTREYFLIDNQSSSLCLRKSILL